MQQEAEDTHHIERRLVGPKQPSEPDEERSDEEVERRLGREDLSAGVGAPAVTAGLARRPEDLPFWQEGILWWSRWIRRLSAPVGSC